ncbi:S1 family peptidase [Corynebacterium comes]|uniref:Serine protease n=1 Tax=Corynebacterium comes TaxID=2675218 RepID=A0A6B8WAR1_9CORY|nr:S1 family peptidase [Corynebacterium comes]QGU03958.1 hypothetical protein CETAM_03400 [Corynebacterium comes]
MTATMVTGAVMLAVPTFAGAETPAVPAVPVMDASSAELPVEQPAGQVEVSSADVLNQVRGQLATIGVHTQGVDAAVTDAVDAAIVAHVPNTTLRETTPEDLVTEVAVGESSRAEYVEQTDLQVEITDEMRERFVEEDSVPLDQNYVWTDDPVSKVMAGKPFADWILHRVPGSWFDAPRIPEESMVVQNQDASLYGPGTPIYLGDSMMCTLGAAGTDAQGRKVAITAGHCGQPGDQVWSADSWQVGPTGTVVASNQLYDYSVIELGSNAEVTRSYNGVTVNSVGGPVAPGDILCKQGVATGNTCGNVWSVDEELQVSQVCAMVGDSGAPVLAGDRMVGMVSGGVWGDQRLSCQSPLQGQLFMPTASIAMDAVLADVNARGGVGAGFRLAD